MVTGVDFVSVPVQDFAVAEKFYEDVLALEPSKHWGEMPAREFEAGNLTIAIMQMDAFGREHKVGNAAIALQVDDVEAERERLEAAGVEFAMDTIDSGVCHMAFFSDPDGNAFILHNRYAPPIRYGAHEAGLKLGGGPEARDEGC